jgi:nucleotide-binding universal stress UspA family protein
MVERVLIPVDGSDASREALSFAIDEWPDAAFVLLHVVDPVAKGFSRSFVPSQNEEKFREVMADAESLLDSYELPDGTAVDARVEVGRPAETIVEVAEDARTDLVVLGSHGRKGVQRLLLGSVSEAVARNAPVPVTIVR